MATLDLDQPSNDPDGLRLMAELRQRLQRGTGPTARRSPDEQYRPAMAAVQALLLKRQALGAAESELQKLRAIADTLQALATAGK